MGTDFSYNYNHPKWLILGIRQQQRALLAAQAIITRDVVKLEQELEQHLLRSWREVFPDAPKLKKTILGGYLIMVQGGCMADKWEPEILIRHIGRFAFTQRGWVEPNKDAYKFYVHNVKFVKPPVPMKNLQSYMKALAKETGAKVKLEKHKLILKPEHPTSLDDIKAIHGTGVRLVEEDEIAVPGWEGTSPFSIFKDAHGKMHVYYSSTFYSGPMDQHVKPGDKTALEKFFCHAEKDNADGQELSKKYEAQILENWQKR